MYTFRVNSSDKSIMCTGISNQPQIIAVGGMCSYNLNQGASPDDINTLYSYYTNQSIIGIDPLIMNYNKIVLNKLLNDRCGDRVGKGINNSECSPVVTDSNDNPSENCIRYNSVSSGDQLCNLYIPICDNTNSCPGSTQQCPRNGHYTTYCNKYNDTSECLCINRVSNNSDQYDFNQLKAYIERNNPSSIINDQCWYSPCKGGSSGNLLDSSVACTVNSCPTNIDYCAAVIEFIDDQGLNFNVGGNVKLQTNCYFGNTGPTGDDICYVINSMTSQSYKTFTEFVARNKDIVVGSSITFVVIFTILFIAAIILLILVIYYYKKCKPSSSVK